MNFVGQALNIGCLVLVAVSVAIFWSNKQLKNEIEQLTTDALALKIELEKVHQTCKDKVVGAFPRIPATHIVSHSEKEKQGLNIERNVTFITLYLTENKHSRKCLDAQIKSIKDAFPNAEIFNTVVAKNSESFKPDSSLQTVGIFPTKAEALNKAIEKVATPYFIILHPSFVIEPKGADTSIEWLHHALVVTPGVDIIGGSVLLDNSELVVPCYSINLCNWTISQKYEYERSFGEIMICDEVSHSFMARKDIFDKFNGEEFDKNLEAIEYMFVDFFLRAKKLDLTIANRPEVLFVQRGSCVSEKLSDTANIDVAIPFARKHQIIHLKFSDDIIHSICDGSFKDLCTTKKITEEFEFPKWYDNGMFAYPFIIQQAIHTLQIMSEKLQKAGIVFALRGETLFGAVMTKTILPWGKINAIQLTVFGLETEITKLAASNGYQHTNNGNAITVMVDAPNFPLPMKVEIVVKPSDKDTTKFVKIRVNGRLYPAPSDPVLELKKEYGETFESYLRIEDNKAGSKFSCKLKNHHACLPDMETRGVSTYEENYCKL